MRGHLRERLDRWALPLGVVGLAAVAAYNWRLWQKDKALLAQMAQPDPLPPLASWPDLPMVSVLVAAWNEAAHVERHIKSFLALRYPHKELVLCAGGADATYSLAEKHAGKHVTVLEQQAGEGKQRALRRGFTYTSGDIIYFTDADCILDDESFERVVYPVATGKERAVSGSSRPLPEQMNYPFVRSQAASQLYAGFHDTRYLAGLLGRNCAVERAALIRSGGLEAEAPTGTDYVLAKMLTRAGARILQLPESRVASEYPQCAGDYLQQQRRWLGNVWGHGRVFGAMDESRTALATVLIGLFFIMMPLAALLLGPFALVFWGVLIAHGWLARARYGHFAERLTGTRFGVDGWLLAPFYLLQDCMVWASALATFFRHTGRWV